MWGEVLGSRCQLPSAGARSQAQVGPRSPAILTAPMSSSCVWTAGSLILGPPGAAAVTPLPSHVDMEFVGEAQPVAAEGPPSTEAPVPAPGHQHSAEAALGLGHPPCPRLQLSQRLATGLRSWTTSSLVPRGLGLRSGGPAVYWGSGPPASGAHTGHRKTVGLRDALMARPAPHLCWGPGAAAGTEVSLGWPWCGGIWGRERGGGCHGPATKSSEEPYPPPAPQHLGTPPLTPGQQHSLTEGSA